MYISEIKLRNWCNFRDAYAKLGQRVFVIGPNASGKTNLLQALLFLQDTAIDGLSAAVSKRGGISGLRCHWSRKYSNVDIEITAGPSDREVGSIWVYKLSINQDNRRRPKVISEEVCRGDQTIVMRTDKEAKDDPELLTQTYLEQVSANKDFRVLVEFIRSIGYRHIIPQAVRDPAGFSPKPVVNDPYGRDFVLRIWKTPKRTRDSRLAKITKVLKIAVPQLDSLSVDQDEDGHPHLVAAWRGWRKNPHIQWEDRLSDGTLRLLGLLWSCFEGDGPLLLEEPELSFHSEVVRHLPEMFSRINRKWRKNPRQIILSTHSAELLSSTSIGPEEVLWLRVGENGTEINQPNEEESAALRQANLTAADVLLPRTSVSSPEQLVLGID